MEKILLKIVAIVTRLSRLAPSVSSGANDNYIEHNSIVPSCSSSSSNVSYEVTDMRQQIGVKLITTLTFVVTSKI